jgi:hypothetical protein
LSRRWARIFGRIIPRIISREVVFGQVIFGRTSLIVWLLGVSGGDV